MRHLWQKWLENMIKDNQTRVVVLILIVFLTLSYFHTNVGIGNDKSLQMQDAASLTQTDDCTCLGRNIISQQSANINAIVNITLHNTTCSPSAFARGSHQKVVSFTFYEPESSELGVKSEQTRHYFEGIRDNLSLMKEYYPGFVMRLYYEASPQTETKLCRLGKWAIFVWIKSIKKLISTFPCHDEWSWYCV